MSMYLSCPCSGGGLPFRQLCHQAVQIQTGYLCVLDSFPLTSSNNRRKTVGPDVGSWRWRCFCTSNPLGLPQSCVAKHRRGGTPIDFRRLWIRSECSASLLCDPSFPQCLAQPHPALPQVHLWVHSLQQALQSLKQRKGNPCRKAWGSWTVTGGDRPLQKVIRVFRRWDYKRLEICTSNTSSLVQHSSYPVTASHSNPSLICLNTFFPLMESQPLWLLSLVSTYPDPFLQRQVWWCCELTRQVARSKVAVTTQESGTACSSPQAAWHRGQGTRRRWYIRSTWDVNSMLGQQEQNSDVAGIMFRQ